MQTKVKDFTQLAPEKDRLLAMQIICPPHPNMHGALLLRAGRSQSGEFMLYEATRHDMSFGAWSRFRAMNDHEIEDLVALLEKGEVDARHGQGHSILFFHKSENVLLHAAE